LDLLNQAEDVVYRYRDKARRDLDDVKADFLALFGVLGDRVSSLREDVLDKPAGRNQYILRMAKLDQVFYSAAGHERE
jgi:hypothetical protein